MVLLALGYWMYRWRSHRRRAAAQQARDEARARAATEKFRPGGPTLNPRGTRDVTFTPTTPEAAAPITGVVPPQEQCPQSDLGSGGGGTDRETTQISSSSSPFLPCSVPTTLPATATTATGIVGASSVALNLSPDGASAPTTVSEEDVEYTELRPDGLTAYRSQVNDVDVDDDGGGEAQDTVSELHQNCLNKRISTSAATHLSRISEQSESEEDQQSVRSSSSRWTPHRTTSPTWSHLPSLPPGAQSQVHKSRAALGSTLPSSTESESLNGDSGPSGAHLLPQQQQHTILPTTGSESDPFGDQYSIPRFSQAQATNHPQHEHQLLVPGSTTTNPARRHTSQSSVGSDHSATSGRSSTSATTTMSGVVAQKAHLHKSGKVELVRNPSDLSSRATGGTVATAEQRSGVATSVSGESSSLDNNGLGSSSSSSYAPNRPKQASDDPPSHSPLALASSASASASASAPTTTDSAITPTHTTPPLRNHSDPFEDTNVINVGTEGARSVRSMASGSTQRSWSSYVIPLIDTSKGGSESARVSRPPLTTPAYTSTANANANATNSLAPASASSGTAVHDRTLVPLREHPSLPSLFTAFDGSPTPRGTAPKSSPRSASSLHSLHSAQSHNRRRVGGNGNGNGNGQGVDHSYPHDDRPLSGLSAHTTTGSVAGLSMFEFQVLSSSSAAVAAGSEQVPALPAVAAQTVALHTTDPHHTWENQLDRWDHSHSSLPHPSLTTSQHDASRPPPDDSHQQFARS